VVPSFFAKSHRSVARVKPANFWRGILVVALLGLSVVLLTGCFIPDESTPGDTITRLPDPTIRRVEPPVLDPAQQKRQDEVDQYLAARYQAQGWQIVDTTQTHLGDIIDWLDPASVPGSQEEPPPTLPPEEMQLPEGALLQLTELDMYPELRGPVGTIPMYRPSFAAYILEDSGASSVEDFIKNYQVPGRPAGETRLYAGLGSIVANKHVASWVNAFGGTIETGTFSLLEMLVACRGPSPSTTREQIGITASRDKANFGDSVLRLQIEFLTAGDTALGSNIGGWDGKVLGFIPAAGRPYGPGTALMASVVGGTQYESRFDIELFNGNWWVGHNGNWLGYYPGSLFDLIPSSACEVNWYGEVYDRSPTTWTWTDMGSGQFASTGWRNAAYFRDPFYSDTAGTPHWPDGALNLSPNDDACYTRTDLSTGTTPWDRYFYLGGPGADAPNCL